MLDKVSKKLLVSLQEHFESQTDYIPLDYSATMQIQILNMVQRLHIMVCITGNSTVWSAMPVGENASTAFYLVLL